MEQKAIDFHDLTVAGGEASYSQDSKWENGNKWGRKVTSQIMKATMPLSMTTTIE